MSRARKNKKVQGEVRRIIREEFTDFLEDISQRLEELREVSGRGANVMGRVYAADLNIKGWNLLHGFVVTNNSPAAGQIAWSDLNMVYDGATHAITAGSALATEKYLWWNPATPTVMQKSTTKPVLPEGGVLIFLNEGGTARNMLSDTQSSLPRAIGDNAVDEGALMVNAVTGTKIKDDAVTSTKLGPKAVTEAKIGDNAVNTLQIKPLAVTTAELKDDAVTQTKIGPKAVTSTEIGDKAVGSGQLGDNAVTGIKILGGAVTPDKTKIQRHFLL